MTDASDDPEGSVSIGGRTITKLHFTDDIDALAWKEEELFKFVTQPDKASTIYGMETSAEKTKLMNNNTRGIDSDIRIGGQNLRLFRASNTYVQL